MEEFIVQLPVVVEMITESSSPNTADTNDNDFTEPYSDDGEKTFESPSGTTTTTGNRKIRRSKRSKTQQAETLKRMECQLCQFDTVQGRADLQHHYMDEHTKEDLVALLISTTYPEVDSDADVSGAVRNIPKRAAILHTCPVCQKNIAGKNNLDKHLIRHSSQTPFKCDECKKTFSAKRDLQLHEMRHHSKERPHVCTVCQKGNIKVTFISCIHCIFKNYYFVSFRFC